MLRHRFATHLPENGTDTRKIQLLLGHKIIQTTAIYERFSNQSLARVVSPFDLKKEDNIMTNKHFKEERQI